MNQKLNLIPLSIMMTLIFAGMVSCIGQKSNENEKVFEAYELRINGHADSAKVLLEQFTSENPEDALAWYELCRTTQHLGMSNPRSFPEMIDESLKYINLAVESDPANALYLSYKGKIETLKFYLGLQMGDGKAADYLAQLEGTYNKVFKMDPTFTENQLTLVEFFGGLPPDMGGDLEKAEEYAKELEETDQVAGAKAREILMPEDADYVSFWKGVIDENPKNADALQALGRVYLFMEDIDSGKKYYQEAITIDPAKNVLYLDLGRYYMMQAMGNQAALDSVAPFIEEQFKKFINFSPEPVKPMKAWAYATLSMINSRMGNGEAAEAYLAKAKELDPFFSPISGTPSMQMFCPPDVALHEQGYYLSLF